MMGSEDDDGMHHEGHQDDSYGHEGSPGYGDGDDGYGDVLTFSLTFS